MTRVVIVGEIYNADLSIGGGPVIPPAQPPLGIWGGGNVPFPTPPMAPGGPPLGTWGGVAQPGIDNTLPIPLPQGGTPVPPDVMPPPELPPEEISSQYIVSVYNPKTMTWTTKSYPPR